MIEVIKHPEGDPLPEGPTEVVRLSTSLAYRVLNTQLIRSSVPPHQVQALVNAAKLMHENGLDWPPGVTEVLRRIAETMTPAVPEAGEPAAEEMPWDDEASSPQPMNRGRRVKRFIRSFRKGKG